MIVRPLLLTFAALAPPPAARAQQPLPDCRAQFLHAEHGVRVDGDARFTGAGRSLLASLPPGTWRLHFPAGGGGRPAALDFATTAGGEAVVAVGAAPRPDERPVSHAAAPFADARLFGSADDRDLRLTALVRSVSPGGVYGLVCRCQDDGTCYRYVWDTARGELRLERLFGERAFVLGRAPAPKGGEGRHRLELQAEGFHLLALCDEIPVFDELDGALTQGRFGTCAQPASGAEFSAFESAPPAVAVPVLAAVRSDGRLDVVARVPEYPAAAFALCLRLDRPGPLVPLTPRGCECFVLQPPALPLLAFGFAFGNAGARGEIEGSCRWPAGKLMRGQAALVGGLIATPNGEAALGWLPWAAVHW